MTDKERREVKRIYKAIKKDREDTFKELMYVQKCNQEKFSPGEYREFKRLLSEESEQKILLDGFLMGLHIFGIMETPAGLTDNKGNLL